MGDNPYAYEGEDVGQGEIPSRERSRLHTALAPLGFEIGAAPGSPGFEYDYLDALHASEKQLRAAGFEDPSIIIDYIEPRLEDIFRKAGGGPGGYRTEALVNAIPFEVFDAATGGRPLKSSPRRAMSPSKYDQYAMYDEEDGMQPMISDSFKRQLKKIVKEEKAKLVQEAQYGGGQYGLRSDDIAGQQKAIKIALAHLQMLDDALYKAGIEVGMGQLRGIVMDALNDPTSGY